MVRVDILVSLMTRQIGIKSHQTGKFLHTHIITHLHTHPLPQPTPTLKPQIPESCDYNGLDLLICIQQEYKYFILLVKLSRQRSCNQQQKKFTLGWGKYSYWGRNYTLGAWFAPTLFNPTSPKIYILVKIAVFFRFLSDDKKFINIWF